LLREREKKNFDCEKRTVIVFGGYAEKSGRGEAATDD